MDGIIPPSRLSFSMAYLSYSAVIADSTALRNWQFKDL